MASTAKGPQTPKALLSEKRVEQVRDSQARALDRLNSLWKAAEKKLKDELAPREVMIAYRSWDLEWQRPDMGQQHACLGFVKYRGEWRICHGYYADMHEPEPDSWKPIVECCAAEREAAAGHLPKLRAKLIEKVEQSIPGINDAADKLEQALAEF